MFLLSWLARTTPDTLSLHCCSCCAFLCTCYTALHCICITMTHTGVPCCTHKHTVRVVWHQQQPPLSAAIHLSNNPLPTVLMCSADPPACHKSTHNNNNNNWQCVVTSLPPTPTSLFCSIHCLPKPACPAHACPHTHTHVPPPAACHSLSLTDNSSLCCNLFSLSPSRLHTERSKCPHTE